MSHSVKGGVMSAQASQLRERVCVCVCVFVGGGDGGHREDHWGLLDPSYCSEHRPMYLQPHMHAHNNLIHAQRKMSRNKAHTLQTCLYTCLSRSRVDSVQPSFSCPQTGVTQPLSLRLYQVFSFP